MDLATWLQIAQTLGIPVACLVALSLAVWAVLKWLAINVLKPLADRHVKFLDSVEERLGELADGQKEDREQFKQLVTGMTEIKYLVVHADKATVMPEKKV